jgi:hypothetical protein
MSILHQTISKLYPQVAIIRGEIAYDREGNEVAYDLSLVNAEISSQETAQATSKASALAKLAALGLTDAEIKALTGN